MQINCKKCQSPLAAEDANIQAAVAKCSRCGAVFSLAQTAIPKPTVSLPRGMQAGEIGTDYVISFSSSLARRLSLTALTGLFGFVAWKVLAGVDARSLGDQKMGFWIFLGLVAIWIYGAICA